MAKYLLPIPPDLLWKGYIEDCAGDILSYCYPEWCAEHVDLEQPVEFLDQELKTLFPQSPAHPRRVDKLARFRLKNGSEQWVLFHIEIQGYRDKAFAERMFRYFYRIFERYGQGVIALAVFTARPAARLPAYFEYKLLGTSLRYEYEVINLPNSSLSDLERPGNPFSLVLQAAKMASDKAQRLDALQLDWKMALMRRLFKEGHSKARIRSVFHFISHCVGFESDVLEALYLSETNALSNTKTSPDMGLDELVKTYYERHAAKMEAKLARELKKRDKQARLEIEQIRAQAEQARAQAEQARLQTEQARAQAEQARAQAAEQARAQSLATARKLLAKGFTLAQVADLLDMAPDKLEALLAEN